MYNKNRIILLGCITYLFALTYFISNENYFLFFLPPLLLFILITLLRFNYIFLTVVFLTPLSMSLSDLGFDNLSIEMAFPTEPILFGILLLTVFQFMHKMNLFKIILKNIIVKCILIYLIWIFIASCTSTMPMVSFKFLLTRLWYVFPFVFIGSLLFQDTRKISSFFLIYLIPFLGVILYTVFRHANYFFDKQSAHFMMSPFFNDHTSYGALIAFFIPLTIALFFLEKNNSYRRLFFLIALFILTIGLILSFTRAAWISLFFASILAMVLKLQINRKILFILPFILLFSFVAFQNQIFLILGENKQDSSDNLLEHVTSISNISTDASNMERINRWNCALKMFVEKPVFGWGPGTYQFQYASFQLSRDKTIISSNTGDMGNAHSEYLGPLCETGFFGFLSFLVLVFVVMLKAIKIHDNTLNQDHKIWLLAIITSLSSYFIHGLFNNFLDTDKASVVIWGSIAIIVAIDIINNKNKSSEPTLEHNFS